jgi:hypothetical protein
MSHLVPLLEFNPDRVRYLPALLYPPMNTDWNNDPKELAQFLIELALRDPAKAELFEAAVRDFGLEPKTLSVGGFCEGVEGTINAISAGLIEIQTPDTHDN